MERVKISEKAEALFRNDKAARAVSRAIDSNREDFYSAKGVRVDIGDGKFIVVRSASSGRKK